MKEQNPTLSVCEIGATIGKMWRELTDEQKQKYNEDFTKEKVSCCLVELLLPYFKFYVVASPLAFCS